MDIKTIIVNILVMFVDVANEGVANPKYYLITGDGKKIVFPDKESMDLYHELNSPLAKKKKDLSEVDIEIRDYRKEDSKEMKRLYREYLKNRRRQIDNHGQ